MIKIQVSTRNVVVAVGFVLAAWMALKLWGVILLAGLALMLAAALLPYVDLITRHTGRRSLAVLLAVLTVLLAMALLIVLLAPPLTAQGRDLWNQAPQLQDHLAQWARERGWDDTAVRIDAFQPADLLGPRLVDAGRTAMSVGLSAFTVFVLAAYILLDARRLERFVHFSTPVAWRRHFTLLLPALQRVVGGYIRGQAITSASIAAFAFVLLTVLDVPNPVALAALAAIFDVIPMIGAALIIAPMALAALTVSPATAAVVVAANLVYQQFEDRVLAPRVYGATMRLPTIAVMLALLAGNELLGVTGAVIALPIAAGARVLVEYFDALRRSPAAVAAEIAPVDEVFAPAPPPYPRRRSDVDRTRGTAAVRVAARGRIRPRAGGIRPRGRAPLTVAGRRALATLGHEARSAATISLLTPPTEPGPPIASESAS